MEAAAASLPVMVFGFYRAPTVLSRETGFWFLRLGRPRAGAQGGTVHDRSSERSCDGRQGCGTDESAFMGLERTSLLAGDIGCAERALTNLNLD